ncbi:hypothetical protein ACFRAR_13170 [Kitasatospora sp. NPDC056651]|uniref:hypothetical protein n=1 Tax=Kitasatospora sp. NPDC056651 TaxID=3345892 RepID=UPI0036B1DB8B
MTDQQNSAPAVWDPTARGGAGGWVRGPQRPADGGPGPEAAGAPAAPQPFGSQPSTPQPFGSQPPAPGAVGDQGPPLGARPYLSDAPDDDPPTARLSPVAPPPSPAAPPFPSHPGPPTPGYGYPPQPPAAPPLPPYGARPDYPTGPGEDEERPANRRTPLLIGFALLLVLAIGGGLLFAVRGDGDKDAQAAPAPAPASAPATGSENLPPVPAPTGTDAAPSASAPATSATTPAPNATAAGPNAKSQAQALDGLLTDGENARASISNAVAKVSSCPSKTDIEAAAQVFDSGASQRDGLLTKLAALSVSDLPGGADAVNSLKSAWQLSADVDRAYAAWARAVATQGCSGRAPSTADKKHADELNPQATQAKADFLNKWKPIATAYGITPPTSDRI